MGEKKNGAEEQEVRNNHGKAHCRHHCRRRLGSDGLPLRMLPCGHVFDETCWREWVDSEQVNHHFSNQNTSSHRQCPVCREDFGKKTKTNSNDDLNNNDNDNENETNNSEEIPLFMYYA